MQSILAKRKTAIILDYSSLIPTQTELRIEWVRPGNEGN